MKIGGSDFPTTVARILLRDGTARERETKRLKIVPVGERA